MWLFYLMKFIALIDLFISEPKNIEFSKLLNVYWFWMWFK